MLGIEHTLGNIGHEAQGTGTCLTRSGHSRHAVTVSESHSEPQSYRKSHEKAPDKTENRMPR